MNKTIMASISCLVLSTSLVASPTTMEFNGKGIDGNPCSVKVVRDNKKIELIELTGAVETFEILSENGSSYGPSTEINSDGGYDMLELFHDNPKMFSYMKISSMFFSKGETISFSLQDVPNNNNDDLGWLNMKFSMDLNYDYNGNIVSVEAKTKMKTALVLTLASQTYICK